MNTFHLYDNELRVDFDTNCKKHVCFSVDDTTVKPDFSSQAKTFKNN